MSELKPFAFVLMPFSKDFDDIYKFAIRQEVAEQGAIAERLDDQIFSETMLERIFRQIKAADFIIADMSGKNPNVFYEVGYAHAIGKLVSLLTQSASDIPFDLRHHRHIVYDGTIADLKTKLRPEVAWLIEESSKRKKLSYVIKASLGVGYLRQNSWYHEGEAKLEISVTNETDSRSPEIDAIYLTMSKAWEVIHNGRAVAFKDDPARPEVRKFSIVPQRKRLGAGAFLTESVELKRRFWTKSSGDEPKTEYRAQGDLLVEVETADGSFEERIEVSTTFDEIPF